MPQTDFAEKARRNGVRKKSGGRTEALHPYPVNLAEKETTHNCLLQALEVLLGLLVSLIQKSGGRGKQKNPSGPPCLPLSSLLHSFDLYFIIIYYTSYPCSQCRT